MTATISKTVGRDMPNGDYIEIEAQLHGDEGTLSPGFSLTCLIWTKRGSRYGRSRKSQDADGGGAQHDVILAVMPELAPLALAHLADPTGLPLHAVSNGWYFYSGAAAEYERRQITKSNDRGYSAGLLVSDHHRAARALHVDPSELPESLTKEGFTAFVASLVTLHQSQADAANAVLTALVDGDGVENTH